jgi:hypothetical protein
MLERTGPQKSNVSSACHAIRPAASSVHHQASVDAGLCHATSMHSGVSPSFIMIFLITSKGIFLNQYAYIKSVYPLL